MALGRLSSQANNSMGYARIFARAVSNPGFDGINTMPFTTLLSAHHSAICADSRVVLKGIIFMSSEVFCSPTQGHATIPNKRRTALRAANWGQWGVASAVLWHNLIFQAPLTPNFRQAAHPDGLMWAAVPAALTVTRLEGTGTAQLSL